MSNIIRKQEWEPSRLRLEVDKVTSSQTTPRFHRRIPVKGTFIAGPLNVNWLSQARKLGVSALWVGLALWYLRGLRKSNKFVVSNRMMESWNVEADAKRRALRKLQRAGLILIEPRERRSPVVTLIVGTEKK
jgi:hypothetical protein